MILSILTIRTRHDGWVHDEDRVKDEDWEEHDGLIQYDNNDAGEDIILSYEKARLDAA